MGIHVQGTIGILLTAYDQKILSAESIKESFTKLIETNRHISQKLFTYAIDYLGKKNMKLCPDLIRSYITE